MQSLLQGKLRNQGENMGSFTLPFLSPSGYNGEKGPRDLIQNSASLANFIYCKVLPLFQLLLLTGKGLSIIWHHLGYILKVFFPMVANLDNQMGFVAKTLPVLKFMGLGFFTWPEKWEHVTEHVIVHKLCIPSSFSSFSLQKLQPYFLFNTGPNFIFSGQYTHIHEIN